MEERDVGMLCYVSSSPGFRGILKQRYSDFIVNELGLDGNVVHLTSLDPPQHLAEFKEIEAQGKVLNGDAFAGQDYASEIELFRSLAGDVDAETLNRFLAQVISGSDNEGNNVPSTILSPDSDKSHRTEIHQFFKKTFKFLVTDTVDGPDITSKCIRVRLLSKDGRGKKTKKRKERGSSQPFDTRGSDDWPEHLGKFLRFHLYKENKDTMEALGVIGKMLGVQSRSFGFAGTKDKRAVTTQRVTVYKQHASKVAALNKRLIGMKVGDFCHVNEALVLGQLQGNQFTITLREVVADSEAIIKDAVNSLGKHGFINYFGLQRFGSGSVPTHLVGAALLRGEWESAVNLILDPRDGERDSIKEVRDYYKENGDIEGTLRQLPRQMVAERAILQCLKNHPGNFLQALKSIPRTLRMMYVHSYQSYLWNHAASVRVQKYGSNDIIVGDLVCCKENFMEEESIEIDLELEEDIDCGLHHDSNEKELSKMNTLDRNNALVKVVTEKDISSGMYTIHDVILPMPGCRIMYPENSVTDVYHDMAKKDAINLKNSAHNVKEFSITNMTGSYRRVLQKLIDFKWELMKYANADESLAETDVDRIAGAKLSAKEPMINNLCVGEDGIEQRAGDEADRTSSSSLTALRLSFALPSSTYATMAVRELLKSSTSAAFHKSLNSVFK